MVYQSSTVKNMRELSARQVTALSDEYDPNGSLRMDQCCPNPTSNEWRIGGLTLMQVVFLTGSIWIAVQQAGA
jgi:hypothetical protein